MPRQFDANGDVDDGGGGGSYTHPNHSGDVTSVGDGAQTIAAQAVTFAKMQQIGDGTILGNDAGAAAVPQALTGAEAQAIIGGKYMVPIWAEENAALANTSYEWAFGNGANSPSDGGVIVHVPAGQTCQIVAMSLFINAGTATVEAVINGVVQGASANVQVSSGKSAVNSGLSASITDGQNLSFRTTSATGTSGPCVVTAWLEFTY